MLLVANLANTKSCKKPEKWLKPRHMGTHLRVLSESYPMNTNMTVFRCFLFLFFFKNLCFLAIVLCTKIASALEGLIFIYWEVLATFGEGIMVKIKSPDYPLYVIFYLFGCTSQGTLSWWAPCLPYKRRGLCGSVYGYPAPKMSLGSHWIWRLCSLTLPLFLL